MTYLCQEQEKQNEADSQTSLRVKEMRRVWANKRMSVSFLGIGIDFPEIQALPSFVLLPFLSRLLPTVPALGGVSFSLHIAQ